VIKRSIAILLLVACGLIIHAAASPSVHMANGIKIGEVDSSSAIVWTRLTEHAERNVDGRPFLRKPNREQKAAECKDLSVMEGAVLACESMGAV